MATDHFISTSGRSTTGHGLGLGTALLTGPVGSVSSMAASSLAASAAERVCLASVGVGRRPGGSTAGRANSSSASRSANCSNSCLGLTRSRADLT